VDRSRARLRAQALDLLTQGHPVEVLVQRASEMPANGWTDLVRHVEYPRVPGQSGPGAGIPVGPAGAGIGARSPEVEAAIAARRARASGL
jgi:hypothetical protein